MASDGKPQGDWASLAPSWQPAFNIQRLAKSLSKDNLAAVPLQKVSSAASTLSGTLQNVTRNGETLVQSAQSHIQRLKSSADADDWTLLGRAGNKSLQPLGMRKSSSDANFLQSRQRRTPAPSPLARPHAPASPEGFDWLTALNERLNKARTSSRPKFQLPSAESFGQQAKQLVHSASGGRLERVATQLLERPREALSTAQQTLSTCQQNLQTLQLSLQQSFVEGKSTLEQQVLALGEPGSPSTSGNRLSALLGPSRLGRGRAAAPAAEASSSQAASPVSPDSPRVCGHTGFTTGPVLEEFVPPPSGAGGARAAGAARTDDESGADEAAGARPWGPFQLQAHLRRRNKQRPASSSLREEGRRVTIVTTAALPWMTGTAVNPLLRAAYLARDGARAVTLMIPWLAQSDQERVFPNALTFDSPDQQEAYVRAWVRRRTGFDADFKVTFYPGRYAPEKCSILPVGDPTAYVPDAEADVAILEEPEHLNWYHHGRRWTDKFSHVVGVVHTNYLDYARREDGGAAKEALLRHINAWVTRIHCHKVVKLSDAVQELPKQTTEFVHGVADSFLSVGERKAAPAPAGGRRFTRGAYFLGKCVWGKGYTELLDLLTTQQAAAEAAAAPPAEAAAAAAPAPAPRAAAAVAVDCFGTGEDLEAVRAEAASRRLGLRFHGAKDHLDADMAEYQVFINPSTSDVVATTSAEALAMGKWVVCAEHPSNAFFSQFSNCLVYRTPEEFCAHVAHALAHEPAPLPPAERAKLTWEAATERFLDITELTENELRPGGVAAAVDSAAWAAHNTLTGMDALRSAVGAGRGTRDNPARLEDYQPSLTDMGGLFDDKKRAAAYRSMRQGPPALPAPKA